MTRNLMYYHCFMDYHFSIDELYQTLVNPLPFIYHVTGYICRLWFAISFYHRHLSNLPSPALRRSASVAILTLEHLS